MKDLLHVVAVDLAKPEDMDEIFALYERVWLDTYPNQELPGMSRDEIKAFLASKREEFCGTWLRAIKHPGDPAGEHRAVFVARYQGKIVGVVSPKTARDGSHRLTSLYVEPEYQGRGIGTRLIEQVLEWHKGHDIHLFVAPNLKRQQKLYRSFGFVVVNPDKEYKFDGSPISYIEMTRPAS